MTALLAVGSLVLGLWLGWWARGQQTVVMPGPRPLTRDEQTGVETLAQAFRAPYEDDAVWQRMAEDFRARFVARGESPDEDVIQQDIARMRAEIAG